MRLPSACSWGVGTAWCADLGIEVSEVHALGRGGDLGWPVFDGLSCLLAAGCELELDRMPQVVVPRTSDACGIAGAAVYRGERYPSLTHTLFYADSCARELHGTLLDAPDGHLWSGALAPLQGAPLGVGRDAHGEVYALLAQPPYVARIVARNEGQIFPERLSDTGCFADVGSLTPAPGVIPYQLNAPLWSDGSAKQRFVELPPGERITIESDGRWVFPTGTVIIKVFSYVFAGATAPTPVETRFMVKRAHGWEFHSYRWQDDGRDALLLSGQDERSMMLDDGELTHGFPSRSSCFTCHRVSDVQVLGARTDQWNRIVRYVDGLNHQLAAMDAIGLFATPIGDPAALPRMPALWETEAPAAARARAYLHSNCAHCHQPGGWVPTVVDMDLRFDTPFAEARLCDVPTASGKTGVRLAPGDPEGSRLLERMSTRDAFRMPPLASERVDAQAVAVVREWITALAGCR